MIWWSFFAWCFQVLLTTNWYRLDLLSQAAQEAQGFGLFGRPCWTSWAKGSLWSWCFCFLVPPETYAALQTTHNVVCRGTRRPPSGLFMVMMQDSVFGGGRWVWAPSPAGNSAEAGSRILDLSLEIILEQVQIHSAIRLCCFYCDILLSFHLGPKRGWDSVILSKWFDLVAGTLISPGWVLTAAHCIQQIRTGCEVRGLRIGAGTWKSREDVDQSDTSVERRVAKVGKKGLYDYHVLYCQFLSISNGFPGWHVASRRW